MRSINLAPGRPTPIIMTPEELPELPEKSEMRKDSILEEIHEVRAQIAKECTYDIKEIIARLKQKEKEHSERVVEKKPSRTGARAD